MSRILRDHLFISFALPGLMIPCGAAFAQTSAINITGRLTDSENKPLSGDRAWQVTFFDSDESETPVGDPIHGTATVSENGAFIIPVPVDPTLSSVQPLFYEIGIDSAVPPDATVDPEDIFPERTEIRSVMFAQTVLNQGAGSGLDADTLDGIESTDFLTAADNTDADSANELNVDLQLNSLHLDLTDAGGTLSVDLTPLRDDADADPGNENQSLSLESSGTERTINIEEGAGVTFSVADDDNDPANEIQTLFFTFPDLAISGMDGNSVDLSSLKDNLGNHVASRSLNMAGFDIQNGSRITIGTPEVLKTLAGQEGPLSPGFSVQASQGDAWQGKDNILASDDLRTTVSTTSQTSLLSLSNFGFAIPVDAKVVGLEVRVEGTADSELNLNVKPSLPNSVERGLPLLSSAEMVVTMGSPVDLWGVSPSPSDVNAMSFGVALEGSTTSHVAVEAAIDHVEITVYFVEALSAADAFTLGTNGGADLLQVAPGLDLSGPVVSVSRMGTVIAQAFEGDGSGLTGINVNDEDSDSTNEIQTLSFTSPDLSISGTTEDSVDLSPLLANVADGHSLNSSDGTVIDAVFVDTDGEVGIGVTNAATLLEVNGSLTLGGDEAIDQEQTTSSSSATDDRVGQSFTAGVDGFLTAIEVEMESATTAFSGSLQICCLPGNAAYFQPINTPVNADKRLRIDIDEPFPVEMGSSYSFELQTAGNVFSLETAGSDVYGGGALSLGGISNSGDDLVFTTFVATRPGRLYFPDGSYFSTAGDGLGDHEAETGLSMNGNDIDNAGTVLASRLSINATQADTTANIRQSDNGENTLLRLEDSSGTTKLRVDSDGAIVTGVLPFGSGIPLALNVSNELVRDTSSAIYKENIQPVNLDIEKILRLEAVEFDYRGGGPHSFGYIAEELHHLGLTELVIYDAEDKPVSIAYNRIPVFQNELLKRHQAELERKDHQIRKLKKQVEEQSARLERIEQAIGVSAVYRE